MLIYTADATLVNGSVIVVLVGEFSVVDVVVVDVVAVKVVVV